MMNTPNTPTRLLAWGGADDEPRAVVPASAPSTLRQAQHALARMGWQIVSVEIDQVNETARVEVKRADGRYVMLDARRGKSTITCEQAEVGTHKVGRRGDPALVERMHMRFLGRDRIEGGFRAGLRKLAQYLDDNALGPKLGRAALGPLLAAPAPVGTHAPSRLAGVLATSARADGADVGRAWLSDRGERRVVDEIDTPHGRRLLIKTGDANQLALLPPEELARESGARP